MQRGIVLGFLMTMFFGTCLGQSASDIYLFSYFKGNGEDGLHLAYSIDGYSWKALNHGRSLLTPVVSKDKLMRDPCIIRGGDGLFHMVWTVSWADKGLGYASSKDLVHWSAQQFLPVNEKVVGARNTWAPELTYDAATATYMIYWATTIEGKYPETASTKDDNYNHRFYYVNTRDFTSFSETKLLYEPGFNCIDATIVADGNRYAMYFKDETPEPPQKNIKVAYAAALAGPYGAASAPITGNYWAEGPTVTTIGQETVVYFDKYMDGKYGAVASLDGRRWTDISDKISLPEGIRHGSIFKVTAAEFARLPK
jgi:Glycosyl hydrolases family 43